MAFIGETDDFAAILQRFVRRPHVVGGVVTEHRAHLDALIVATVPDVKKCVRWNSPFYGMEGQGWFLSYHVFTSYVKVTFFKGSSLRPLPPGRSKGKDQDSRWIDIHEDDLDETRMTSWIQQAAALPGWNLR